ncbi:MAG: hypothetical protein KGI27_11330 [Thaumarchaeota archaeon]|nr:hypothetical protein [Nitrososphaerota archaeon]
MKTLHLSIITGSGIAALVTLAVILLMTHSASADGSLAIIMNKHEYGTEEPIQFFVQTGNQPEENAFPTAFIVNGQNQTVWYDDDLPPNGSKEGMNEYYVSENSWNVPMINQTGRYSLFVTYEGQKAYEALTVTELVNEDGMIHFYGPYQGLDNNNGTAQIANQTYYLMTVSGAPSDQTRPNDTTIAFHGVSFTFPGCGKCLAVPMPFNPLQPVIVKFSDNTTETLAVRDNMWSTIGMQAYTHEYFPNGTRGTTWKQIQHRDQIVTTLTSHTGPQAGITVTHDSVKLLVSENPQNVELGAAGGPSNNWSAIGMPFQLYSPLKQFKSGIESKDVKCNSGYVLVVKAEDGSPACVKPETAQKLIERGWAREIVTVDPMANLANDTGTITMDNQTYYFETPRYSQDAYANSPQISFHGVTFTLFPTGFRGGLPVIHCGLQGSGLGQYYWADSKFSDNTHELLHLFAYSPSVCNLPIPSMLGTHTNPQAGLAFYDGKMKLLVSTDVDKSSQQTGSTGTTGTIELRNTTYDFLVLNSTMKGYHNPSLQTVFDGVEFTLLPGPWSGGPPGGCSGTPFSAEAKASDGLYIPLRILIPDEPCKMNSTTRDLGWHHGLGAGLAVYNGKVMILVSKDEKDSGITQISLKAYGFVCCGMYGDLLKGNLSSTAGPIPDANVTISVNGILMGYAKTLPDGCFQFNQWNESKLSNQTSAYLAREKASGSFSPFPLTFTALYPGDLETYFPASAIATSSESLIAVPFPPPQLESTVTPSQVNVTQGSSASIQISVRPMIESWNVTHMNLYLDQLPCGISYEISQASDNDTSSVTHPAVFNVTLKAAPYSPEGTYFVGMEQNGTNSMVSRDAAGTFSLNVLK